MATIIEEIKEQLNRPNNTLIKLIILNVAVFLVFAVAKVILTISSFGDIYSLIATQIALPAFWLESLYKPWTYLSYGFFHEDIFHLLFNMLFLYTFGKLVNEYLGSNRVLAIYLLGAIAGGLFYVLCYNLIPYFIPKSAYSILLGASASVFAIVMAAATLLPDYSFNFMFIGQIKIKYIAAFYLVLSFISTVGLNAGGNLAHLGGGLLGYIFITQLRKGNDLGKPVYAVVGFISKLFSPKPNLRVTYRNNEYKSQPSTSNPNPSTKSLVDVDDILDKISKSGYESLTKEEKQRLFEASQK